MAPTVTQPSCYHKPGSDGIGVSEKEAKADGFTNKTSKQAIPLKNYLTGEVHYDTLYQNAEKVVINQRKSALNFFADYRCYISLCCLFFL